MHGVTSTLPPQDIPPSDPFVHTGATPTPAVFPAIPPQTVASPPSSSPPTPQTPQNPTTPSSPPRKTFNILLASVIAVVLLLLGVTATAAYMVTYQRFSIGQPKLERALSMGVQSLPLLPKTPQYVLEKNLLAHQGVTSEEFSLSIAAQSDELLSSLGTNSVDLEIAGSIEYSDLNNILLDITASVTKDLEFSVKKPDSMVYVKVTKVPEMLFALLGMEYEQVVAPFLNQWISYDTATLQTDAREVLNKQRNDELLATDETEAFFNSYAYQKLLDNTTLAPSEMSDGTKAYQLSMLVPPEVIEYIFTQASEEAGDTQQLDQYLYQSNLTKISDMFDSVKADLWIDTETYLMRKMTLSMLVTPVTPFGSSDLYGGSSPTRIVLAYSADKHGEPVTVTAPSDAISVEDLMLQFQQLLISRENAVSMYDDFSDTDGTAPVYPSPELTYEQSLELQGTTADDLWGTYDLQYDQVLGAVRTYNELEGK